MTARRTEHDLLGQRDVPADALWGIAALRASENFPLSGRPVNRRLVRAYGAVKLACAKTNRELGAWANEPEKADAIEAACEAMMAGELDEHVIVDALQGGAGTSTNMNVNEVLANAALLRLGQQLGGYEAIDPHDDLNRHQSTNDTYPTALRVAAIGGLRDLEPAVVQLIDALQAKEKAFADVVKVGRTELQDAVLTTLGRSMGAFAEAFARDRWRISKCEERLRSVNLGGTAIGTGVGAPRRYIFRAVEHLRSITGYGLARSENLVEATQNADAFVEVSGMLRALAVNLLKMSNDLRLMSSGPSAGLGEITLPAVQPGSSIMPGKVNPVIPEAASQCAIVVMAHDQIIAQGCGAGNLELNHLMPMIADSLLTSIDLLIAACRIMGERCIDGLEANRDCCRTQLHGSTAMATALVDQVGYEKAQRIAVKAAETNRTVREIAIEDGLLTGEQFDALVTPEAVMQLGRPDAAPKAGEGEE